MTKAQKRRKARADKKAQQRADRLLKKQSRQDTKLTKKTIKADLKLAKNINKNDRRMSQTTSRQDTKSVAYSMGIDPNAWIADTVDSVGDTVVGVFEAKSNVGGGFFGGNSDLDIITEDGSLSSSSRGSSMTMLAVIGAVLLFMFKK
tara:strand:- start:167 stop:607 length:441 start_codon:yes stop_codon:yes gene_type:complete